MIKGIDYTGICICFYCYDGQGNYLLHKRSVLCSDEHDRWDFGGGGLHTHESLEACLVREVEEEYGVTPIAFSFLGFDEVFREHEGKPTHWLAFRYVVQVDPALVVNNEPEKHSDIGWYKITALPQPLHSQLPRELEKYKDKLI